MGHYVKKEVSPFGHIHCKCGFIIEFICKLEWERGDNYDYGEDVKNIGYCKQCGKLVIHDGIANKTRHVKI